MFLVISVCFFVFFFQAEDGIRDDLVTGVQTCALPIYTQVLPAALCGGEIAAFFIWQPIGSRTLEICPDKSHYLTDATGYIQGYLVAGARPEWLASPQGKDTAIRWLRATIEGPDVPGTDFAAVAS